MRVIKSLVLIILIFATGIALGATELYIPGAAHAGGVNGANWRSDLQVMNYGSTTATFKIGLMAADADNGLMPTTIPISINPGETVRYVDVLDYVFSYSGGAALKITSDSDTILATSRTYNLIMGAGVAGVTSGASFGQWVPAISIGDAVFSNQEGRLIMLTQTDPATLAGFRTNVGVVNVTAGTIDVALDIYRKDGVLLGTVTGQIQPYGFHQWGSPAAAYQPLDDFYVVVRPGYGVVSPTKFLAFATVIDNHQTGDPVMIPAMRTSPPAGANQVAYLSSNPPSGSSLVVGTRVTFTLNVVTSEKASILAQFVDDAYQGPPAGGFNEWIFPSSSSQTVQVGSAIDPVYYASGGKTTKVILTMFSASGHKYLASLEIPWNATWH